MLLLYAYLAKWDQPDALEYYVDNSIMQRFSEFKKIIIEHRKNKPFAQQLLKTEFRDTYWYYWMFVRSK